METKKCSKCKKDKPVKEFHRNIDKGPNGRSDKCMPCAKEYMDARNAKIRADRQMFSII